MSEGKLKQEVKAKNESVYDITSSYADDWYFYKRHEDDAKTIKYISNDNLLKILDEAKKEFPIKVNVSSIDKSMGAYENDLEIVADDWVRSVYSWFEKWFGGQK